MTTTPPNEPFEGQADKTEQLHVRMDLWLKDWFREYSAGKGTTMSQIVIEYIHALRMKELQEKESGDVESI